MKTTFRCFSLPAVCLLTIIAWNPGFSVLAATGPVSQAWAVRIQGPANTYLETAVMAVGASGDVFLASHIRGTGFNYDIHVSRRSSTGALVWEKQYMPPEGSTANELALGIATSGTNVYVTGSINTPGGNGTGDFLTLKYRDTGELEWAARTDGPGKNNDVATALAIDRQGNVVVLGESIGTNGSLNIVVLKYAPTGTLLWTYSYDGPEHGPDRGVGLRVDASGNIVVAGTSGQSSEDSSVITLKLDSDGHELWTTRETSGNPYGFTASGLDLDSTGNVVTAGRERSYCVTWKYDANGNRQWMARYRAEEPASMIPVGVRFDSSGNIIIAANLYGSGTNDSVLIKYAPDGRQLWASRISHPNGAAHLNAMAVDAEGNSYVTTSPAFDVITVKVSPTGAQLWSVTYNSQGFFSDYGEALQVAGTGDIFISGRSTYFSDSFVSLVKYTQQTVAGVATGIVTPSLQVVNPGTSVGFQAQTTGPGPIEYQWRKNGRPLPGATNATLALADVQAWDRGDYSVILSNPSGITITSESRLTVKTPPEVIVTPTETVGYVGTDAGFVATVAGNDFATLQWRRNGAAIAGATNEILRLFNLSTADSGLYDIVVSTQGGTAISSAARLRVSSAVELVGATSHRSALSTWEYSPQLRILPSGESLIAARSNHVGGGNIVLHKYAANGALEWSTAFDSSEFTNAEPSRLALDRAGNIYITGVSRQPYINAALAVLKYSPQGQLLWSRILTGTNYWGSIHAFAVDPSGNSALAVMGNETTVIRYNPAGETQWSYLDPSSPDNDAISLAIDTSGHSYLGTTIRTNGDNQIRLRKFDATGALDWSRPYADGHYNRLGALAVDAADHLIVAGTGELTDVPDSRLFVQKYSPAGEKLWETRTGWSWSEISYIVAMAVGPGGEVTVLTESDDDYEFGEQSGITRVSSDGQLKYRIAEPQILASNPSQLAVDDFGNAYVTGYGGRPAFGVDAVTAKYDAFGNRPWLVHYNGPISSWLFGLAVGADATGDIRVLATRSTGTDSAEFSLLHYRQRDAMGRFRLQLIPHAGGSFHLATPTVEPFRIEASENLQDWTALSEAERQQLLQPGATAFSSSPRRFYRLVAAE